MPTLSDIFGGNQPAEPSEPNAQLTVDDGTVGPPEADPGVGEPVEPPPFDPDPGAGF